MLTPDEVLRLPNDELLIILRGQKVLRAKKFDFTEHPYAKECERTSIQHYQSDRHRLSRRSHRLSPCLLSPTWTNRPDRRLPTQSRLPNLNRPRQSRRRPTKSHRHPAVSPRTPCKARQTAQDALRAPGRRRIFNCPPP